MVQFDNTIRFATLESVRPGLTAKGSSSSIYFGVSINKILFIIPKGHKIIKMSRNDGVITFQSELEIQIGSVFTNSLMAFLA